jgi:hypothetical protein
MIDKIELLNIFNPETYNTVKTLPTFRKKLPSTINLDKKIKYIHKNFNSINLLDYYIRSQENTSGIHVVAYSNVISKILMGIYTKKNFTIEVITDRQIIYLNDPSNINSNEFLIENLTKLEIFKNSLLNNNKNMRYGLSKVRFGKYNLVIGGKIDATIFNKNINILLVKKLTYRILLDTYINGIITNTYKILYGIINKDNKIRYLSSLKIEDIKEMLSLDENIGKNFFDKIITAINNTSEKYKFLLTYNANNKEIIIE